MLSYRNIRKRPAASPQACRPVTSGKQYASTCIGRAAIGRRVWVTVALATACLPLSHSGSDAQAAGPEYEAKAACLHKMLLFVEWPNADAAKSVLTVGILGQDPLGDSLQRLEGHRIGGTGQILKLTRFGGYRREHELDACEVVFICRSEVEHLHTILDQLAGKPVLTVADFSGFAKAGGMVELVQVQEEIRWRINCAPLKAGSLQISGQLLRNALNVITSPDGKPVNADGKARNASKKEPGP